jgi:N-acetylneuraminate epimerase
MTKRSLCRLSLCLLSTLTLITSTQICSAQSTSTWSELSPLPDAHGFAGMIAGVSGGQLFAAGGANFPDRPPWDGGTKVWYDRIYRLENADAEWQLLPQKLPQRLGYAVCVTWKDLIVVAGGETTGPDGKGSVYTDQVFALRWHDGALQVVNLPSLPYPLSNACWAVLGERLLIAGGSLAPAATATSRNFLSLDLSAAPEAMKWNTLPSWPGPPRMLAVAAATEDAFYLLSGTDLSADAQNLPVRRYLQDAYRYAPAAGWKRIADLPRATVAAVTPAPIFRHRPLVLSGDDGSEIAIPQPERTGFSRSMLSYDPGQDLWTDIGSIPAPTVTVPCVHWKNALVCVHHRSGNCGSRISGQWALDSGRWTVDREEE